MQIRSAHREAAQISLQRKEFTLSRETLRCGTSIGEHVACAQEAASRPGFAQEINTALQYAVRTGFRLCLLRDAERLDEKHFNSISNDCDELQKLLRSIGKSADPRSRT
ncbi:MAG: four helix bundle protein [Blastocatellia bacterium]